MVYGLLETLKVTGPDAGVLHVELNRPDKLNAMNQAFWDECRELFREISHDTEVRVIVISAAGRAFTAGLDIMGVKGPEETDAGRKGFHFRRYVLGWQESFNAIEACPQPVIVVAHGAVVGGGIDLMCACCIRYASKDAWFTIKEVDIGVAADLGTLQRLPKIIGNEGAVRELAYTARKFHSEEAMRLGFVQQVFDTKSDAMAAASDLAALIASKSPLAVVGTKRMITHARDHSVQDGLDYIATWNSAALQAPDMMKAAQAGMQKKTAEFSKL